MKRSGTARNRIRRESTAGASLFPFLAVLICTMGALILLLVVIARQSRLQAAQDSADQNADVRGRLSSAREWAQVQIDEYRYSREATERELVEARLELGHLEDHGRRLREQLARLEAAWSESQTVAADGTGQRDSLEAELARLEAQIAQSELDLAAAKEAGQRRGSYAVVPYQGPHSTRRRPIYIECRQDAVVLQPEGIVFGAADFDGPLGPGNPLEVALRAIREYLIRHRTIGPDAAEPYPLLLVRPDGIEAYYDARAAMKSWASDFGYELIGDDWTVEFQPPDPQMLAEVSRAVDTARSRQRMLLAAAPRRYDRQFAGGYVATPHRGGFVPQPGVQNHSRPDDRTQQPFARFGNRSAPGGSRYQDETSATSGSAQGGTASRDEAIHPNGAAHPPGETTPRAMASDEAAGDGACPFGKKPQSLARVRGRNWGLPNATQASVPITSPIRIDCHPDRLILVPERGLGRPKIIFMGPRTGDSVDELVSNVWDYMKRWGSAGNGMHWRPALTFHVAPDAQSRYADLEALLDQSGLMVRRSER